MVVGTAALPGEKNRQMLQCGNVLDKNDRLARHGSNQPMEHFVLSGYQSFLY
jgi:hypothetical protein